MTDYDEQQVQPEPEGVPVGESTEPTEPASDEPAESDGSDDPTFLAGVTEENAVLLLAAAEEEGLDPSVVVVDSTRGGFIAPEEVVSKAKEGSEESDADSNEE
jgi:hypothetical protein